jgi:hypothetical protein
MTDQNSSQNRSNDIAAEFAEFGQNIKRALQSAWTSDDRKTLQADIEKGLKEASDALKQATNDFSHSQVGQTLKTEADDFQKRVKSGELEAKVRSEVLAALRMANDQLKKAFSGGASSETRTAEPPAKPEEK